MKWKWVKLQHWIINKLKRKGDETSHAMRLLGCPGRLLCKYVIFWFKTWLRSFLKYQHIDFYSFLSTGEMQQHPSPSQAKHVRHYSAFSNLENAYIAIKHFKRVVLRPGWASRPNTKRWTHVLHHLYTAHAIYIWCKAKILILAYLQSAFSVLYTAYQRTPVYVNV